MAPSKTRSKQASPTSKSESAGDSGATTLADLAEAFLGALEEEGKSPTTIRSYRADLALACSVVGPQQRLAELTPAQVAAFNEHPRVTHTLGGEPKARPGLLKHRRVLRLALVWAASEGLIESAPLPE